MAVSPLGWLGRRDAVAGEVRLGDVIVELQGVTVEYAGGFRALDGVDLRLPRGSVGLLGPNGAGKTSLVRALLGHVRPTSGSVRVFGEDPTTAGGRLAVRARVGYMPEGPCLLPGTTGVEMVVTLARLSGMSGGAALTRAHDALDAAGLGEARYRAVHTYSLGMQQRVKLAQAIVHRPDLLLLDEPTDGLDPKGRSDMLDRIRGLAERDGRTVLLCSHVLRDVERSCSEVVVLDRGRVRAAASLADLLRSDESWFRVQPWRPEDLPRLQATLSADGFRVEALGASGARVRVESAVADPFLASLAREGIPVALVEPLSRTLDEVFLSLVGRTEGPAS